MSPVPSEVDKVSLALLIWIVGVNDKLESASVPQPHRREMADVTRCEATDAEIFGEHHDGRVVQTEAKVGVSPVNLHRSREPVDRRRRIRERRTREVVHESIHRLPLVTKEVVDFRQHQSGNVSSSRSVDGLPEALVIGRAFHEVVEQGAGIAN
jgi:hypothetical protein